MATHASAEKRHRESLERQSHNRWWKSRARTASKAVVEAVTKKDAKGATEALKKAMSEVSRAKREGVLHANAAARKIARLSKKIANLKA